MADRYEGLEASNKTIIDATIKKIQDGLATHGKLKGQKSMARREKLSQDIQNEISKIAQQIDLVVSQAPGSYEVQVIPDRHRQLMRRLYRVTRVCDNGKEIADAVLELAGYLDNTNKRFRQVRPAAWTSSDIDKSIEDSETLRDLRDTLGVSDHPPSHEQWGAAEEGLIKKNRSMAVQQIEDIDFPLDIEYLRSTVEAAKEKLGMEIDTQQESGIDIWDRLLAEPYVIRRKQGNQVEPSGGSGIYQMHEEEELMLVVDWTG